jgi:outer membrane protein OmpA-like peptidoglycan-associated protein
MQFIPKNILFPILFFLSQITLGQEFQIRNIDASQFPLIEANIVALNKNYKQDEFKNLIVKLKEEGKPVNIEEIIAPKSTEIPLSILLLVDKSGSMQGNRMQLLKMVSKRFVEKLPLHLSEVALASFNDQLLVDCFFTHDIDRIKRSIDKLDPSGGTSFQNAFLPFGTGAFDILKSGKFKKVIVFITDGSSQIDPKALVAHAMKDTVNINTITIDLPITSELRYVTKYTRGKQYSDLYREEDVENALDTIYNEYQQSVFGRVKWFSEYSCKGHKDGVLQIGKNACHYSFDVPNEWIGKIELSSSSIAFEGGKLKQEVSKSVLIRGKNVPLVLEKVNLSNGGLFSVQALNFPIHYPMNQWMRMDIAYLPKDTLYHEGNYSFVSKNCPEVQLTANSGGTEKINIKTPNESSVLAAGEAMNIEWSGIQKQTPVTLFCQGGDNKMWHFLGTGSNYSFQANVPNGESKMRVQAQVTNNITTANLMQSDYLIFSEAKIEKAVFSPFNTTVFVYYSDNTIKAFDVNKPIERHAFERIMKGDAVYHDKTNRILDYSDSLCYLFTNRNGLFMRKKVWDKSGVLVSLLHAGGKEYYTSAEQGFHWSDVMQNQYGMLKGKDFDGVASNRNASYLLVKKRGKLIVVDGKTEKSRIKTEVDETFNKAVLHGFKPCFVVENRNNVELIGFNSKKGKKYNFPNSRFKQFSSCGNYLLLSNEGKVAVVALGNGDVICELSENEPFAFEKSGKYFAGLNEDTLEIWSTETKERIYREIGFSVQEIQFLPNQRLLVLEKNNLKVIDFNEGQITVQARVEENLIKSIDVSKDGERLLIASSSFVGQWKISNYFDADTTAFFTILHPKLSVEKHFGFGQCWVGNTSEKLLGKLISNNSNHSIYIDSIAIKGANSNFRIISGMGSQSIAPGEFAQLEIGFSPRNQGIQSETLLIYYNSRVESVQLTGEAILRSFLLPTLLYRFKPINTLQKSEALIPVIVNRGTEILQVEFLENTHTDENYTITPDNFSGYLKPNDTLWAKVYFHPQYRGFSNSGLKATIEGQLQNICVLEGEARSRASIVVAGFVRNSATKSPVEASVIFTSLHSSTITSSVRTNSRGFYHAKLPCDINYSIAAQKASWFSSSENADLRPPQFNDTLWVDLSLTAPEEEANIPLNNIFFKSAKAALETASFTELKRLVNFLEQNPGVTIEVHGHTDDLGSEAFNLELSKERALSVKQYLIAAGIDTTRIGTKYFGKSKPIAGNSSEEARKKNRRVEVRFCR